MSNELQDPALAEWFATTPELPGDEFTEAVAAKLKNRRRRILAQRLLPGVLIAPLLSFLQRTAQTLAEWLTTSLVSLDAGLLAQLLAPINSVAGALSIALLLARIAYLRVFR